MEVSLEPAPWSGLPASWSKQHPPTSWSWSCPPLACHGLALRPTRLEITAIAGVVELRLGWERLKMGLESCLCFATIQWESKDISNCQTTSYHVHHGGQGAWVETSSNKRDLTLGGCRVTRVHLARSVTRVHITMSTPGCEPSHWDF